jgi:hypothetical protein
MRWITGTLLIGAAVLKAAQLLIDPPSVLLTPFDQYSLPAQIGAELCIGLLAIAGTGWKHIRWIVLFLFAAFAVYSLKLALGGAFTCGCFGVVKVHPWWTLTLDTFVVLGLLISIRSERPVAPVSGNNVRIVKTIFVGSIVFAGVMSLWPAVEYSAPADQYGAMLGPRRWIGGPLPIADSVDLDLSAGYWIVLLYRNGCDKCDKVVPLYETAASAIKDGGVKVALIEVPPFGDREIVHSTPCAYGHLRKDRDWFIETPLEIRLRDGIVINATIDPIISTIKRSNYWDMRHDD